MSKCKSTSTLEIGEVKIISAFLDELSKVNLSYITDIGYREFLDTGESFGICSNQFWKLKKQSKGYNNLIAQFYANELLRVKRQNHTSSIRVQGQSYNRFLEEICNYGMGNVLVIFKFCSTKVKAYYFLANGKNHNALNYFYNDNQVLENVVKNIESDVDAIVRSFHLEQSATPLFSEYIVEELFGKLVNKKKCLIDNGNGNIFTARQTEILKLLAAGCTRSKMIAQNIDICPRTAEWHIKSLRTKTNQPSRAALVQFAKTLVAS